MNFLAHLYLSGNDEQVMVGNFIADWVRGKKFDAYTPRIVKGILMHREIDSFTDHHPLVKQSKAFFYESHQRYSGIVTDIVYDHFLSSHWKKYSVMNRLDFISSVHSILYRYRFFFPGHSKIILPSLVHNGWLHHYISFYGLEQVLQRMSLRTSLPEMTGSAIDILRQNYSTIEGHFESFFDELRLHIEEWERNYED